MSDSNMKPTLKETLEKYLARKEEIKRLLRPLKRDQVEWSNLSWELQDIEYDILLLKEELDAEYEWDRQNIFEE